LYQNPKLLSVLCRQAVRRANDLFTWQRVTGAMADLYEEVLSASQPARCDLGRRPQAAWKSTSCTTWELRVVGAGRRAVPRAVARS
ncbi:MAG: hypothetical protein WA746_18085, partial [Isosphaeraceae bacterium]